MSSTADDMHTRTADVIEAVDRIHMTFISKRILAKTAGWSLNRVIDAVQEYKCMFVLAALGVPVSPCPDVDVVWHEHIMHTQQYADDCCRVMHHFLHHCPSDGSEDSKLKRAVKYDHMLQQYRQVFGHEPHSMWIDNPSQITKRKATPIDSHEHGKVPVPQVHQGGYDGCDC
jgi:hypothetical protein